MTLLRAFVTALLFLHVLSFGVLAQETQTTDPSTEVTTDGVTAEDVSADVVLDIPDVDTDAWDALATRAEDVLETADASDAVLEDLRSQIAEYRSQFLNAQSTNDTRIEALRSQITALGTPEEGETESDEVAARRVDLEQQLTDARAPAIAAEEAYSRANGLVAEIDDIIRTRQTDRLIELGPSPANPALWAPAWRAFTASLGSLGRETSELLSLQSRMEAIKREAPAWLFFATIGLVLLIRGRHWARTAGYWVLERTGRGARVWAFLVSLCQIILPLAGVFALVIAIEITQLLGTRGSLLLEAAVGFALILLSAIWVADRVFSRHDGDRMLPMAAGHRKEARLYAGILATVAIARGAVQVLADYDSYTVDVTSVLDFPFLCITALILFRLGQMLSNSVVFDTSEDTAVPIRARFVRILGRAATIIAVIGPILALIGFGAGARALVYPAVTTLLLSGLLLVLQRFTSDLYRFVTRAGESEEDSLVSVLIGFMLTLGAVPLLALIWGARVADITEVWTRFREGVSLGETRISPTDFIAFVVIFFLLYSATRLLQSALRNTILPKTTMDKGAQTAVVSGVGYVGIFFAALIAISATGLDLSSLAIVAGALSVGIGFGLQNIVSNFVSGIILLIERPIAEGDWIEVGGQMGYVRDISVRSTRIQTFDRSDVIVPNADLVSGTVTNYTRGNTIGRVIVPVGVAYGTDTRRVETILLSIARQHDMVLMNPAPYVVFQGFGADSMDFEIRAILRDVNYVLSVKSDMNHQIAERFAEENIEIPFAQRDVWLRNPEALAA